MSPCSMVSELKLRRRGFRICVFVVRVFLDQSVSEEEHTSMVLSDEQGTRIVASVPKLLWSRFKEMIREGAWFYNGGFRVMEDRRAIKLTTHDLCLSSGRKTFIERTDPKSRMCIYSFSTFSEILNDRMLGSTYIVDVLGVVVGVSKLTNDETLSEDRDLETKYKLLFTLRDLSGNDMRCIALGKYAIEFECVWRTQPIDKKCICVLRFWRVMGYEGRIWLSSGPEFSENDFNPLIEEVKRARNMLSNGAVGFEMIEDAYMDCPMRRQYLQQQVPDLEGFVVYYP